MLSRPARPLARVLPAEGGGARLALVHRTRSGASPAPPPSAPRSYPRFIPTVQMLGSGSPPCPRASGVPEAVPGARSSRLSGRGLTTHSTRAARGASRFAPEAGNPATPSFPERRPAARGEQRSPSFQAVGPAPEGACLGAWPPAVPRLRRLPSTESFQRSFGCQARWPSGKASVS